MTADIVWLKEANDDLDELYDFIAAENSRAAADYVEGLRAACDRLISFPLSGRSYNDRYRVIVYRNHLILYRYVRSDGVVLIAAIIHGHRDISDLLGKSQE